MVTRIQAASVQRPLPTVFKLFLLAAILATLLLSGLRPTQAGEGAAAVPPGSAAITEAAEPTLFKDLVSGSESSSPSQLSMANDLLFFRANSLLWKSDGTPEGTIPSAEFSFHTLYDPKLLGEVNGSQMVFALENQYGYYYYLWKTDGTSAGTEQVHDLDLYFSTDATGVVSGFRVVDDVLYFFGRESSEYIQLWKSDGTQAGTQMVKRIPAGEVGVVEAITMLNNQLYFLIRHVNELWKTDGTADGTVLVKHFQEYTEEMVSFNGQLFIGADDGDPYGYELWVSDGTPEGTTLFIDINPGSEDSSPKFVGVMGDQLFFGAKDPTVGKELWATDGTPEGTTLVKDINTGSMGSYPEKGGVLGSNIIFSALDSNFDAWLWRSDGTETGTELVVDDHILEAWGFTPANDVLYFEGYHPDSGYELWQTDGSAEGTSLVADIYPGSTSSYPGYFTIFDGKLFFSARDEEHGDELWALDLPQGEHRLYLPLVQK